MPLGASRREHLIVRAISAVADESARLQWTHRGLSFERREAASTRGREVIMSNPPNQGPPGQPGWGQGQPPGQPGPFRPQGQQGWGGQQPPPQQPWGQQPPGGYGPPPPNGASKKMLLIAGAGALVLAIIVVLVLAFALGGGSSPKSTVESFIKAAQRQDCDEAFALLSDRFQEEEGSCAESEEDLVIQEDRERRHHRCHTGGRERIQGDRDGEGIVRR